MTYRRVPRWRAGLIGALALVSLGLLYASPLLLAATLIPLTYVAYGALSTVPSDAALDVERAIAGRTPSPGDRVAVSLTVENVGEATLPDVRIVDGVPDELAVVDGSPRRAVSLRPGESATLTYSVVAKRGEYEFDDPVVRVRSLSAGRTYTTVVPVAGDESLACLHPLSDAPTRNATTLRAGTHPTDSGGEGLEFRSTRAYQPGDPISRIHWRRYAKTNELTTVSFREERAVRTVLIVDARAVGRVAPRAGVPTGTELSGYAAERLYEALSDADAVTSVAAVGVPGGALDVPTGPGGVPWVDGTSDDAPARARLVFEAVQAVADEHADDRGQADDQAPPVGRAGAATERGGHATVGETTAPDGGGEGPWGSGDATGRVVRNLLSQFPPTAQVVFATPLLDDWPVTVARTARERGYPVTIVSPDVTGDGSFGSSVLGIERRARLRAAETADVRTISWQLDDPIDVALTESITHLLSR